jgi:hypothetical protein
MLWIANTFYTTLSKNDWRNGKNSRTKVVVLATGCGLYTSSSPESPSSASAAAVAAGAVGALEATFA